MRRATFGFMTKLGFYALLALKLGIFATALAGVAAHAAENLPERMTPPGAAERPDSAPLAPADGGETGLPVRAPVPAGRPDLAMPKPDLPPKVQVNGNAVMPEAEKACRAQLNALGVRFRELDRLSEPAGCLVEHPIAISSLGKDMELAPDATVNCATALMAAGFLNEQADAAARDILGSGLSGIAHASAYVCRPRNGSGKLSEHAFGNALDIASFELDDGRRVEVKAYGPDAKAQRDFIRRIRALACGPFRTVLGPGSDADHATHLHLDLQERRRSSTFCQ